MEETERNDNKYEAKLTNENPEKINNDLLGNKNEMPYVESEKQNDFKGRNEDQCGSCLNEESTECVFFKIQKSKYPIVLVEKLSSSIEEKYIYDLAKSVDHEDSQESDLVTKMKLLNENDNDDVDTSVNSHLPSVFKTFGNLLKCSLCTFETRSKRHADKHCHMHSNTFRCSECEGTNELKISPSSHLDPEQMSSKCSKCKKVSLKKKKKRHLTFKCHSCPYKTNKRVRLKTHMLTHVSNESESHHHSDQSSSQEFQCTKCDFKGNSLIKYKDHILKHHGKISHHRVSKKLDNFTEAIINESGDLFSCSLCNYITKNKHHAKRHGQTHSAIKLFKCAECNYGTNRKDKFMLHTLNHSEIRSFECSQCNYKTNEQTKLKVHFLIHSKKNFKCSQCEFETSRRVSYETHLMNHNRTDSTGAEMLPTTTTTTGKAVLITEAFTQLVAKNEMNTICNKYATMDHIESKKRNEFRCSTCNYDTDSKDQYEYHILNCLKTDIKDGNKESKQSHDLMVQSVMKVSDDNISYCSLCSYKSKNKCFAKRHALTHFNVKMLQCLDCDFNTNSKDKFKSHNLKYHPNKFFKCPLCTFITAYKNNLNTHMLEHNKSGIKLFHCSNCTYNTNYRSHLNKHMLSMHNIKKVVKRRSVSKESFEDLKCELEAFNEEGFKNHLTCGSGSEKDLTEASVSSDQMQIHKNMLLLPNEIEENDCKKFYQCFKCSFVTDAGNLLEEHLQLDHDFKYKASPNNGKDNIIGMNPSHFSGTLHECRECHYETYDKADYEQHLKENCHFVNSEPDTNLLALESVNWDAVDKDSGKRKRTENTNDEDHFERNAEYYNADIKDNAFGRHTDIAENPSKKCKGNSEPNSNKDNLSSIKQKIFNCFKCSFFTQCESVFVEHLSLLHQMESQIEGDKNSEGNPEMEYKDQYNLHLLTHDNKTYETSQISYYQQHEESSRHSADREEVQRLLNSNSDEVANPPNSNSDEVPRLLDSGFSGSNLDSDLTLNDQFIGNYIRFNEEYDSVLTNGNDFYDLTKENNLSNESNQVTDQYELIERSDNSDLHLGDIDMKTNHDNEFITLIGINNDDFELSKLNEEFDTEENDFELNKMNQGNGSKLNIASELNGNNYISEGNEDNTGSEFCTSDIYLIQGSEDDKTGNSELNQDKNDSKSVNSVANKLKRCSSTDSIVLPSQMETDKVFSCLKCDFTTTLSDVFEKHMSVSHKVRWNSKSYKCSECHYVTERKDRFTSHMLNHSGIRLYQCPECPYGTNDKWNYNRHQVTWSHGPAVQDNDNRFTCPHCDYKTNHTGTFKRHLLSHSGIKPFKCAICGFETNRKYLLKTHAATHSKGNNNTLENIVIKEESTTPEVIEQLSSNDNDSSVDFMTPKNVDNSLLEFSCNKCSYQTTHTGTFKRHMLTHNGLKRFKCSLCEFETNRKYLMNTHVGSHMKQNDKLNENSQLTLPLIIKEELDWTDAEEDGETSSETVEQRNEFSSQGEEFKMHQYPETEFVTKQNDLCNNLSFSTFESSFPLKSDGSYFEMVPLEQIPTIQPVDIKYVTPDNNQKVHELSFNEF